MLAFLQGLAFGLFLSCPIWFFLGLMNPAVALPHPVPTRWRVIVRYWFVIPSLAVLLWLTSLWGGLGPSLWGWLAGLAAVPVSLPVERAVRRWYAQLQARRARRNTVKAEQDSVALDGREPPEDDPLVVELWQARRKLSRLEQTELAVRADRVYTRYRRLRELLDRRFHRGELAYDRSLALISQVCRATLQSFQRAGERADTLAGMDPGYVRNRLAAGAVAQHPAEHQALRDRLALIEQVEGELQTLGANVERALTALDDAGAGLTRLETRPAGEVDAERALDDLRQFTERSERYGRNPKRTGA